MRTNYTRTKPKDLQQSAFFGHETNPRQTNIQEQQDLWAVAGMPLVLQVSDPSLRMVPGGPQHLEGGQMVHYDLRILSQCHELHLDHFQIAATVTGWNNSLRKKNMLRVSRIKAAKYANCKNIDECIANKKCHKLAWNCISTDDARLKQARVANICSFKVNISFLSK